MDKLPRRLRVAVMDAARPRVLFPPPSSTSPMLLLEHRILVRCNSACTSTMMTMNGMSTAHLEGFAASASARLNKAA